MTELLPDLLRAAVSTTMNVVLMLSLLQPKYGKKVTCFAMLGILTLDFGSALYCYIFGSLTLLARIDFFLFTLLCFAVRPLFKDTFMQWLFSYLTVQNISYIVIIFSFIASRHLPYPPYANNALRLVLFLIFYFLLRYRIRPLYRQLLERWNVFFYVALSVYLTFGYYSLFGDDIVNTLTEQAVPLLLLITVALMAYMSIFHALKVLLREAALGEENLKLVNSKQLLRQSAQSMEQRIALMDESAKQMSIINHDRKHLNNTLQELLEHGNVDEALCLLKDQQTYSTNMAPVSYCENAAANAAIGYYAAIAKRQDITCDIHAQIPAKTGFDSLELSMVLSNLMENAINACVNLPEEEKRYLQLTVICDEQLIIETENPYGEEITLDENGCPTSADEGHGIGTKSIHAFAERYGGEVIYKIADDIFNVRLIA